MVGRYRWTNSVLTIESNFGWAILLTVGSDCFPRLTIQPHWWATYPLISGDIICANTWLARLPTWLPTWSTTWLPTWLDGNAFSAVIPGNILMILGASVLFSSLHSSMFTYIWCRIARLIRNRCTLKGLQIIRPGKSWKYLGSQNDVVILCYL